MFYQKQKYLSVFLTGLVAMFFLSLPVATVVHAVEIRGTMILSEVSSELSFDLSALDTAHGNGHTSSRVNWGGNAQLHTGFIPGGFYDYASLVVSGTGNDRAYSTGRLNFRGPHRGARALALAGVPLQGRYSVGLLVPHFNFRGLTVSGSSSGGELRMGLISGEYRTKGTAHFGPFSLRPLVPGSYLIRKENVAGTSHYTVSMKFGAQDVRGRISVKSRGAGQTVAEFNVDTTLPAGASLDLNSRRDRARVRALMVFLSLLVTEWL